ncbi:MAG: A/G-specific adenine glycosylase [Chitinophagaceae bacterium]|nr:A/G-specific adenine glycosylase [Chitinophagaceae bacterium]
MHPQFTPLLMRWHRQENNRQMPWKGEQDPYKIWLSEVILQQTRVEQGWAYYERFIQNYPTIQALAAAPDKEVFKCWEGLGYYNRCRNLLFTARYITRELQGIFPRRYEDLLALKGVGPYTAAAIASFAYNLPYAVVDGNVFRVLSRFLGIDEPIDSNNAKQYYGVLANELLDTTAPGEYNQAIMDFGATVCKPASPACASCPLQTQCYAYAHAQVNHLPVKEKTLRRKTRWFSYFWFEYRGKVLVRERTGRDIWQQLHEFYLVETEKAPQWNPETVQEQLKEQLNISGFRLQSISLQRSQQLTHQQIRAHFIRIGLKTLPPVLRSENWVRKEALSELAFPRLINQYLQENPV